MKVGDTVTYKTKTREKLRTGEIAKVDRFGVWVKVPCTECPRYGMHYHTDRFGMEDLLSIKVSTP